MPSRSGGRCSAIKAEQAREYRDLREGPVQIAAGNGIAVTGAMTN